MPIYDMHCPEHGHYEDIVCRMADRHNQGCPAEDCGEKLRITPRAVQISGFTESRPLEVAQIGRTFNTNEELRQYQRETPDAKFLSASERKENIRSVRERCEKSAVRQGFKDLESKRKVAKANLAKGRNVFGNPLT